ncbi:MAG: Na+-transporting NADH:ubiquinone oxidoreductase subunit A, partial [bacterium]
MIKIKKGLDLPIDGTPEQKIYDGPEIKQVAVLGVDYIGMRPTMKVQVGDKVKLGDLLFIDKKTPGVKYTSPASGTVAEINRGEKRALQSVVIDVDYSSSDSVEFNAYSSAALESIDVADAKRNLIDSGLWASFRTRPFSKTPAPESTPNSIFVTAMDSNPLAADAKIIITENKTAFKDGLKLISRLTTGKIFICSEPNASIPGNDIGNAVFETFSGPHPAGLAGTHIHHLDPVSATKTVWSINYQDVIAIGKLFTTGKIFV